MTGGDPNGRKVTRQAGPSRRGMRSCIGCRVRFERDALARLVCSPEGQVVVDRYLKAPGRGAHLCYDRACLESAVKRRAFGRAFKRGVEPVTVERLAEDLLIAIERRVIDGLALGRRAGQILSGTDVLLRQFRKVRLLVLATDVAENTADRLTRAAGASGCPVVIYGDATQLGATQGKLSRVALGVTSAPLAHHLREELERRSRVLVAG